MILAEIMNIGALDLDFIEKYHTVVANSIDYSNLEHLTLKELHANTLIYEIFYQINYEVFTRIKNQIEEGEVSFSNKRAKNKLVKACKKRIEEFSPFINCLDSWFQNELDNVGIEGCQIEKIAEDVMPLLLKNM